MPQRWNSRAKRNGGALQITLKRQRQAVMLLRATRVEKFAKQARETLQWMQENEARCLNTTEEAFWKEIA